MKSHQLINEIENQCIKESPDNAISYYMLSLDLFCFQIRKRVKKKARQKNRDTIVGVSCNDADGELCDPCEY